MKVGEHVQDRNAVCGISGTGNPAQESEPPQMTATEGCEGGSEEGGVQEGVVLEECLSQMLGVEGTNAKAGSPLYHVDERRKGSLNWAIPLSIRGRL